MTIESANQALSGESAGSRFRVSLETARKHGPQHSTKGNCSRCLRNFLFGAKVPIWMRGLLIASGIAVASLALIYQPVKIEGNSMTPVLSNHEAIIINRLVYHFEPIRRGDVVVAGAMVVWREENGRLKRLKARPALSKCKQFE